MRTVNVQSAFDELLRLLREQGFTVESLTGGRWYFERGQHHVIARVTDRETLLMCVDAMLSGGVMTCTRQVRAYLDRWAGAGDQGQ